MLTNIEIQERRLELIQWLSVLDDTSVFEKVARLKDEESIDWWEDTSEPARVSILKGVGDADGGNLNPHSQARSVYEMWL